MQEPPWEDIPESSSSTQQESAYVTQSQHSALLQMVKDLQAQVRQLMGQKASAHPEGTLQSGKYAGKTRDWVVENAPDYVVYLKEMGYIDKWGFSEEQIKKALASPKLEALQRARK